MDVIIRNQDIRKLETTCFGLTLAIFRFHLEIKLILRFVTQLMQKGVGVEYSSHTCLVKNVLFYRCEKLLYLDPVYLHMWGSLRGGGGA